MSDADLTGFYESARSAGKIIVVDLGFLGDTIHLIPALWEIRDHYPNSQLHVLTTPVGSEVLNLVKCVDRSWSFPLGPPSPKWWEHLDVLRAMRAEKFDLSINFSGGDRPVFVTRFIKPRQSIAYRGGRQHFWQPWLIPNWIPRRELPTPVYESRRDILRSIGFKLSPLRFNLTVPGSESAWAMENIPAGSIHISLNASACFREWPINHLVQCVNLLLTAKPGRTILVSAAPNEREQLRLREFRSQVSNPNLRYLEGRIPIMRLAAILQQCALHFGPDSGVLHLANAAGVKTVSLFRHSASMSQWLPLGPDHFHFDAECGCIGMEECPCEKLKISKCLATISPEAVAAQIRAMLGSTVAQIKGR